MTTGTIIITTAGVAVIALVYGLYRLGKNGQSDSANVKRTDVVKGSQEEEGLHQNSQSPKKLKVDFEKADLLTFEELAKWIGSVDIPDADSENLICHLVRYGKELQSYHIDLSELSEDEIKKIVVAHVMDEKNHKIYSSKWVIADAIDADLSETFGSHESVNIK